MNQTQQPGTGLPRGLRITRSSEFADIFAHGHRWPGRLFTLWLRETVGRPGRLGVVAGRKTGIAVRRVRARRLMREAYRLNRQSLETGFDVVMSARQAIFDAKRQDVEAELLQLANRAGILLKKK